LHLLLDVRTAGPVPPIFHFKEIVMKRILYLIGMMAVLDSLVAGCDKEENVTGPAGPSGPSGIPDSLVLARQFPPLLANGIDEIEIRAAVVDGRGRGLSGVGVFFTTTAGTIEPFATTDQNGVATTTLTSAASAQDVTARISAVASSDSSSSATAAVTLSPGHSARSVPGSSGASQGKRPTPLPPNAIVILSCVPLSHRLIDAAVEARRVLELEGAGRPPAAYGRRDPIPGRQDRDGLTPLAQERVVSDETTVRMRGITVMVSANPSTIPADGLSSSRISAILIETTSRIPLDGEEVRFGASVGSITGRVTTDLAGVAVATLTGVASGATSTITAFYGSTLIAQTAVTFSALTLVLTSESSAILANGSSTTRLIALLINAERNPMPGARVDFSTDRGTITSPVSTNDNGEAVATLTASTTPGTAHVTARFGSLSQTADVVFAAVPATADLLLSAEPGNLPADGVAQATLSAIALDGFGFPMPDGTLVSFGISSGPGKIIGPQALSRGGEARAIYVAGTTPGSVSFTAVSGNVSRTARITLSPLEAGNITLTTVSTSVLADGFSSTILTATVTDDFGNPVAQGTPVQFATSLGVLEAITPTNAAGAATARLRAGRFQTGLARVTAAVGNVRKSIDVDFVSEAAHHMVLTELDRPSIGVIGTGSPQTATLTFEARDRFGIPVDSGHSASVTFTIVPSGAATDATLAASSATTNDRGRVAAVVRSGAISGAIEVRASIGSIMSEPIRVAVHGDLPDPDHFSIAFQRVNIGGLVLDGIRNEVVAHVGDQHGNPVPDSTAVWFSSEYGLVQGSAFTDGHGEAKVWEITAGPHPALPGGDGLVRITAQTVSKSDELITTSGFVMWSGPTIVEITSPSPGFTIPDGGSITINFRVRDANNNPLTGGTTIQATTTEGSLAGDDNFVMPDTQDDRYTFFSVTLSDDDPGDSDPAASVTVEISVRSEENGNETVSITGVLN
jgi:adhesin/invasin